MKILYHHRTSAQDGSAVHIDGLVEALRTQGHEVIVLAPPAATAPDSASAGVVSRVRRRLPRAVHELLELLYNVPEAIRLARAVRDHRPDVIYERSNLYTISGALLAHRLGVPRITEVNAPYFRERSQHGGIALKALARWTEDFAWQRADAVIPVTQVLARMVEDSGVARERIEVMGNGIDSQLLEGPPSARAARQQLGWADKVVLGFTGYVRQWNGLDPVIDILAAPGNESLVLLVVGDGTARAALEQRAQALGVEDRVRFTGLVKRSEIPYWVSAFDIALQPAANPYASPLKLFEYMALGRAIVAPDQPNIREVLQHERNALLFDPGREGSFAEALRRLVDDSELRHRLQTAAALTVRQREMTWSQNARRVAELADQLVHAPVPGVANAARR
ncbi:MAG: glycosyltransferase family 4 protein [Burkholderiaceae bacterium]